MGKVVDLCAYRESKISRQNNEIISKKDVARHLIGEASLILSNLGEREERVAWLLEEGLDLLEGAQVRDDFFTINE